MKNSFNMKLNELYRELYKEPNSPLSFMANIIYTRYGRDRKKMLAGLYRLYTGNGYVPTEVMFAPFTFDVLSCTPKNGDKPFELKTANLMRY